MNDNPPPTGEYIILPKWDQLRDPDRNYAIEIELDDKIKSIAIDPQSLLADINPMNDCFPFPKIQFDWLVEENFPPVDAYQIRNRPEIGYNIIDGFELGWRMQGSYLEYSHRYDCKIDLGMNNFNPDVKFEYATPITTLHPWLFLKTGVFKNNGFIGGGAALKWLNKPLYKGNPHSAITVGYEYRFCQDDRYVPLPDVWNSSEDNSAYLKYWVNPGRERNTRIELGLRTSVFSRKANYSKVTTCLHYRKGLVFNLDGEIDFGAGMLFGDDYPRFRLFYNGGWEPDVDRKFEFWGSKSLIPTDYRMDFTTQSLPGLFGSIDRREGKKAYSVLSGKLTLPWRFGKHFWLPFYGKMNLKLRCFLFGGVDFNLQKPILYVNQEETMYHKDEPIYEIGAGIRINGFSNGEFFLAFPFYYNHPADREEDWKFRWAVVFKPNFDGGV